MSLMGHLSRRRYNSDVEPPIPGGEVSDQDVEFDVDVVSFYMDARYLLPETELEEIVDEAVDEDEVPESEVEEWIEQARRAFELGEDGSLDEEMEEDDADPPAEGARARALRVSEELGLMESEDDLTNDDPSVDRLDEGTEDECPLTEAELRDATKDDPREETDDAIEAWIERSGRAGENDE